MGCACVTITLSSPSQPLSTTIQVNAIGTFNGNNYYYWNYEGQDYYLYYNPIGAGQWEVSVGGLGFPTYPIATFWKNSLAGCPPLGSIPVWAESNDFDEFTTSACSGTYGECCIQLIWCFNYEGQPVCVLIETTKVGDGSYTFSWTNPNNQQTIDYTMDFTGGQWVITDNEGNVWAFNGGDMFCPIGEWVVQKKPLTSVESREIECPIDPRCFHEDRIFKQYEVVTLPDDNIEDDRGNPDCCCEQLVLGSQSANSWENDITPAWIKVDASGSANIVLKKEGEATSYPLNVLPIVREANAYYAEINWGDVLASDGAGCYTIEIEYNIAGIVGSVLWGNYNLMPYSIQNAMYTARVRAVFNSYFYKENIDFTDTNMQGTLRFNGMIGKRQPNTEIDNIIYGNREMKSVFRENLNTYEIATDPLDECIIKPLVELYLLHENNLFISDYNFHNHSYLYNDLPVILEESADITYFDWSRKASLVAKVGDKVKNNINNFK